MEILRSDNPQLPLKDDDTLGKIDTEGIQEWFENFWHEKRISRSIIKGDDGEQREITTYQIQNEAESLTEFTTYALLLGYSFPVQPVPLWQNPHYVDKNYPRPNVFFVLQRSYKPTP